MTYVKAPTNVPVGLNMEAFENKAVQNEDSSKKDVDIINECMDRHNTFNGVM